MSCYLRHLNQIFSEAQISITPENRKKVDLAIHKIMGTEYKDCPLTWKKLKLEVMMDEKKRHDFIARLKREIS